MTPTTAETPTRHRGKFVGIYFLLTIFMGAFVLFFGGRLAFTADLIAIAFFLALTAAFYDLSKPAPRKKGH